MAHLVPPGAEERYVWTAAGRLRVLHAGSPTSGRPSLLLVHGGGTDNAGISWYRLFGPLATDHEVWAVDLPGFGGSMQAPPVGGPGALADVLADVLAELGTGPVVACGVSMGGDVVLNLGLRHPDRLAGLVLIAPGGLIRLFRNRAAHIAAWMATRLPDWLLLPATRLSNRFVRSAVRAMVKHPDALPPVVVEEFAREARAPGGSVAYLRYNQASIGPRAMLNDLTDQVHRIQLPALFFHGQDDPLVDPADSRRAAERMPRARLVLVPDCGHWAQLEAHDRFLAEARSFLSDLEPGT